MATINGSIKGATLLSRSKQHGLVDREVWQLSCNFAAYTGAADTATVTGVGAALGTQTRDGKTRTLRWGAPGGAGYDTAAQAVFFTGASVQAGTVSSDDLTGNLSNAAGTELTSSTASVGVPVIVCVDVS
jgi:hypothetical protein